MGPLDLTGDLRIGIDLGGTKIAAAALARDSGMMASAVCPTPKQDYDATIRAIASLVADMEGRTGLQGSVGIGIPGSISPSSGLVQNANSTWLNGRPFDRDLEAALGRPVRMANDANCFALSEAVDGAGAKAAVVFGVILGTGCGGGIVVNGRLLEGPHRISGEWGHTPLPWPAADETPGPVCWCGRSGCLETWVSGPALAKDYFSQTGAERSSEQILDSALAGEPAAKDALARHASRLARGLAAVVNIVDPEVIVLGGGLSDMAHLYEQLPPLMAPYIFADNREVRVEPPAHGSTSGVRGAAWLWDNA